MLLRSLGDFLDPGFLLTCKLAKSVPPFKVLAHNVKTIFLFFCPSETLSLNFDNGCVLSSLDPQTKLKHLKLIPDFLQ